MLEARADAKKGVRQHGLRVEQIFLADTGYSAALARAWNRLWHIMHGNSESSDEDDTTSSAQLVEETILYLAYPRKAMQYRWWLHLDRSKTGAIPAGLHPNPAFGIYSSSSRHPNPFIDDFPVTEDPPWGHGSGEIGRLFARAQLHVYFDKLGLHPGLCPCLLPGCDKLCDMYNLDGNPSLPEQWDFCCKDHAFKAGAFETGYDFSGDPDLHSLVPAC